MNTVCSRTAIRAAWLCASLILASLRVGPIPAQSLPPKGTPPAEDPGQAALSLEQEAALAPPVAARLYREAAESRERRGEYGQALLDYQLMLAALPPEDAAEVKATLSLHLDFLTHQLADVSQAAGTSTVLPAAHRVAVPAGIAPTARALEIEPGRLRDGGLDFLASYMISLKSGERQRRQKNFSRTMNHYTALLRHLRKKGIVSLADGAVHPETIVFSFQGDKGALKRTRDFLSFFGVRMKQERTGGRVTLEINTSRTSDERRQLLRDLGVNLVGSDLREIRLQLSAEYIACTLDETELASVIPSRPSPRSGTWLEGFIRDPGQMATYTALAACPAASRREVIRALPATDPARTSNALRRYGPYLEFKDGRLVLPGSAHSWAEVLGGTQPDAEAFLPSFLRHERGRLLHLYYALSGAPRPVQDFFTASAERLNQLYKVLPPEAETAPAPGPGAQVQIGFPERLLRLLQVDEQGLYLPLDPFFAPHLFGRTGVRVSSHGQGDVRIGEAEWTRLAQLSAEPSAGPGLSFLEVLEFLVFLQKEHPAMLSGESISSIMSDPAGSPVFMDLILDIDPEPPTLVRYLAYCRELGRNKGGSWDENRSRTSQAVFFLIAALRREQTISPQDARHLLDAALSSFDAAEEGRFALQVSSFLADDLLTLLAKDRMSPQVEDPLLAGLAGLAVPARFHFDGALLEFDRSAWRLQQMKGVLQLQQVNTLPPLLAALERIRRLDTTTGTVSGLLSEIRDALGSLRPAPVAEGSARDSREAIAHSELETIRGEVESWMKLGAVRSGEARSLAKAMHPELGVALLSYCYAYAGRPEVDALAFDPALIRKHDFSRGVTQANPGWRPARTRQAEGRGTYLAGSLSGLGYQLSRQEEARSGVGLRDDETVLPAAVLLNDIRLTNRPLRTDRAQEAVALSAALARELLYLAGTNLGLRNWLGTLLADIVSPAQRAILLQVRQGHDAGGVEGSPTPSELFLLGRAFLAAREKSADFPAAIPALRRLQAVMTDPGSPETGGIQREIGEYGVQTRSRLGVEGHTLSLLEPYERLEREASAIALYERVSDLKVRVAEISYSLSLPASLGEELAEAALRQLLPDPDADGVNDWRILTQRIQALGQRDARRWIERLRGFGILTPAAELEGTP